MTTPLVLFGVRGDSPIGLLVACGIVDLLARTSDSDARLGWTHERGAWRAQLLTRLSTAEELAEAVVDAVNTQPLDGLADIAGDANKVSATALGDLLADDPATPVARALTGLCAEFPPRANGQAALSPLCVTSFYGKRSVFGTILASDRDLTTKSVLSLLNGPWVYAKGVNMLGLDPAARQQDGARLAVDPSADKPRGVPGAMSLAARGLTLLPPLVARGRVRVPGATRAGLSWPIWTPALRRSGVRALIGRAWHARTSDRHATHVRNGCGVAAVYSSAIVTVGDDRRFARARLLP